MKKTGEKRPILITGNDRLSFSIAVCLLQSGDTVTLHTSDVELARKRIVCHIEDAAKIGLGEFDRNNIEITDHLCDDAYSMAIAITNEDLNEKRTIIADLEQRLDKGAIIAINTESISMADLQEGANAPERIIGVNWTEPAHTTYFLEILTSNINKKELVEALNQKAINNWNKDPYTVHNAISIRSRLFSAMVREAFYLVENGYATVQDIDRACRNDAGYYLPFAGNFRYMDLMGTYSYAEVMKKLNADLSK
ncbi:MAG TPA: 3-hydroxyacyl-CoA dehydrogenase NAD-binding domain-containing protein, partial [Pedobacter sp.]|uniref:3-hydroxyacyl-CoA dehydrogenase NAD-binding domain-containing protein n=1 Tax=Pedobacter sp. TaxID=1411316 RepID=UPI002CC8D129